MSTTLTNLPEPDPAAEALALLDAVATALRWAAFSGAEALDRQAVGRTIAELGDHDWSGGLGPAAGPQSLRRELEPQSQGLASTREHLPSSDMKSPRPTAEAPAASQVGGMRLRSRLPLPGTSSSDAGPGPTRPSTPVTVAARSAGAAVTGSAIVATGPDRLHAFRKAVDGCDRCALHRGRTRVCHGEGEAEAPLMVIVDPPRGEELAAGQAIAGADRALLQRMMASIGLTAAQVYVAPLVRCGPQGMDPEARVVADADALGACRAILGKEIDLVRPRMLLLMTHTPGALLAAVTRDAVAPDGGVERLRERVYELKGRPAIVSWPP